MVDKEVSFSDETLEADVVSSIESIETVDGFVMSVVAVVFLEAVKVVLDGVGEYEATGVVVEGFGEEKVWFEVGAEVLDDA